MSFHHQNRDHNVEENVHYDDNFTQLNHVNPGDNHIQGNQGHQENNTNQLHRKMKDMNLFNITIHIRETLMFSCKFHNFVAIVPVLLLSLVLMQENMLMTLL